MPFRRERSETFILQELTLALRDQVRDPRVDALSITEVDVTKDRRIARVYVACYSGQEDLEEGLKGLRSARRILQQHLFRVLHWPFTPRLEFRVDKSWEYGERIDRLIDQVQKEREQAEQSDAD